MPMGNRRFAATRRTPVVGPASIGAQLASSTPLVHVSSEATDTPPTTIPPRPRTVGPRLQPARHGEFPVLPRRRA
jgi:hypothetical protein